MQELQSSVHDLNEEMLNLDRQADVAASLVRTLEDQLASITEELDAATDSLSLAQTELDIRRAGLQKRLVAIYKRGPMYTFEALLSAPSFGQLVARYKYLHQLARHDQHVVQRVAALHAQVARQRDVLVRLRNTLEINRQDKSVEEERLRALERQRGRSLVSVKRAAQETEERLAALRRDEARLGGIISAAINAERRRTETATRAPTRTSARTARPAPATASAIRTSDVGQLDWPVQGTILYDFGRAQKANNTAIRWNGIGIAAAMGSPVKVVAPGTVLEVARIGTYGLTVVVAHGGNDFSLYSSLASASVAKGAALAKGQQVGTVGTTDPELPAHVHFEIRRGGPAVDPKSWLRARR